MMIQLKDIRFRYKGLGTHFELGPLSVEIPPGEFVFWIGRNGSGKSTAAKLLAHELVPDGGEITKPPGSVFYHHQMVSENAFAELRVRDHLRVLGTSLAEMATTFPELAAVADKFPDELSGGQLQLVSFASILARKHRMIILDEVVNHLDARATRRVFEALRSYLDDNHDRYCVIISHDKPLIQRMADRVHLFEGGCIARQAVRGDVERLFEATGAQA